jgi:hemerythrin
MRAAAHGDIELEGMSKEEAQEYVEGHKVKHLPERVEKFVEEKRKIKKDSNFNRVSAGMEDYIISWIQNHPFLEDKEFDRFLASSGYSPEQGKER